MAVLHFALLMGSVSDALQEAAMIDRTAAIVSLGGEASSLPMHLTVSAIHVVCCSRTAVIFHRASSRSVQRRAGVERMTWHREGRRLQADPPPI